jgi:hypothetical protein
VHWLLRLGLTLLLFLVLYVLGFQVYVWGLDHYNDWTYGTIRTFHLDAAVGHRDSVRHPTHFMALNLHGRVDVLEFPGGDPTRARIYLGAQLVSWADAEKAIVTLEVSDVNGDGRPDLVVHVTGEPVLFSGTPMFTFVLLNTGVGFQPMTQQP